MISEDNVVSFVEKNMSIIASVSPSFFEMTVAMAFNYFSECNVDVAVVEVGLGGRLDSTNIITPLLSVITNIGHDHMDLLGDSLEKIAVEKAGIIKKKVPVLISETQPETERVFIEKAIESDSPISFADKNYMCNFKADDGLNSDKDFLLTELSTNREINGKSFLAGDYQSKNIQAVFNAFSMLKNSFEVSDINITEGIRNVVKNTGLYGRWQVLSKTPLTICDTGHNKEGLEYVLGQVKRVRKSALHIVLGFVNDKDLGSVLPLFPKEAFYYFTKASVPRALNEVILKTEAEKFGLFGESFPDVASALGCARKKAKPSDMIFIGGSTFVVAEAI
jgi:dihydrofolate synthase/folylpolyglutamate synthase